MKSLKRMSQKIKQNVSAFVDGDKDSAEILDKLKQDKDLEQTFGRYHLIGDVMRNDVPEHIHLDLSGTIAEAIDKEPVVLAPNSAFAASISEQNEADSAPHKSNNVVSMFKNVMQYGVAASFAAALVIGFQAEQKTEMLPEAGFEPAIHTLPIANSLDPVSAEQSRTVIDPSVLQEQRRRVNSYIQDHTEQLKNRQYTTNEAEIKGKTEDENKLN
jgi:sigma-E factor negative regulatory protein RseA